MGCIGMHHGLRFYRRHSTVFLHVYLLGGKLSRLPLVGTLIRAVANAYGFHAHASYSLSLQEAKQVVELSHVIALGPCSCRQVSHHCHTSENTELIIGVGTEVLPQLRKYESITSERAKSLLED